MNGIGALFTVVASALLLSLPRRLAAIPLLLGAAYMTRGQVLELGPADFTVMRILVFVGFVRVLARGEHLAHGKNAVDRILIWWALTLLATSAFHVSGSLVFRAGIVWTDLGCYFLFRIFLQDAEDVERMFKVICAMAVPLALLMIFEKSAQQNPFGFLGGVNEVPLSREGQARATGPFAHPILAGTVGASCFGMACGLWKRHRTLALMGWFGGAGIVYACTSSGPILVILFIILGLMFWPLRRHMRAVRWLAFCSILALDAIMKDPVYFLMARIDISGGSQGYYRAQLIRSSIESLNEWWLAGTDYTRHWMASGQHANDSHTDITNHVLAMGVMGGLLLMSIFILLLIVSFRAAGRALRDNRNLPDRHRFLVWTLGAILFGHVMNFMSISLFDQSIVFFYFVLAAIGACQTGPSAAPEARRRRHGYRPERPVALLDGS